MKKNTRKSSSRNRARAESMDCQDTPPCRVRTAKELFKFVELSKVDKIMSCSQANLMEKNDEGETLLHRAVSMNVDIKDRQKVIECLLSKAPGLTQEVNNNGETALCHACKYLGVTNSKLVQQCFQLITYLVESYPSAAINPALNIADHHNKTPLHYMMTLKFQYFSRSAIHDANLKEEYLPATMWVMIDSDGVTTNQNSEDRAAVRDYIILALLKKGAIITDGSDIITVARSIWCCFEVIEYLLEQNPKYDVNTRDEEGATLLIQYGDKRSVVTKLLYLGADVTIVTETGKNVLTSAIRTPDISLIQMLRAMGAEFSPKDPLMLTFMCQIYWCFPCIPNSEEWLELFKTVISLPSFQTPTMPTILISILKILKDFYRATERPKLKDSMLAIVEYDPIKINSTFIETNKLCHQTVKAEPIAYIIGEFLTNTIIDQEELIKYILEMIRLMLDTGFTVSNNPGNNYTTVTAILTIKQRNVTLEQENTIKSLIKELISRGANIESMALNVRDEETNNLKQVLCLPDAVYMAFVNDWKSVLDLLLQYWCAPPLALLLFNKTMPLKEFISWYEYLSKYQIGIPHGTQLYSLLTTRVEATRARTQSNQAVEQLRPVMEHFNNITSSPVSLLELSNFAVRESLAKAAIQTHTSLPKLFKTVLPIQLPTKLYNCIQSEDLL